MRCHAAAVHILPPLLLSAALVGGAHAQPDPKPNPDFTVAPCAVPGVEGPARCGTLRVWEDRAARAGRKIPI
ncbi:MAG TPA: hypothetical protein VFQ39_19255, partial [Longimicrobium sp.]|nr:hypothetical protein [Longimicrobium sp.]